MTDPLVEEAKRLGKHAPGPHDEDCRGCFVEDAFVLLSALARRLEQAGVERERAIEEVEPLVRACFREFFGPGGPEVYPDEEEVALPGSHITFGMVRRAWAGLFPPEPKALAAHHPPSQGTS